jgi:hypothetical protein
MKSRWVSVLVLLATPVLSRLVITYTQHLAQQKILTQLAKFMTYTLTSLNTSRLGLLKMLKLIKDIIVRVIGVILFAFIPGMAVGAPTVGWVWGGVNGVLTVAASIVVFFGVQLAWSASLNHDDIEKGFRAAVAKQDNKDVKEAIATSQKESVNWDDFGSDDDEELKP